MCRYDSLLLVAGGIGITPFLGILQEISSAQNSSKYKFPSKIQLIYVVKSSQDICLLNSISHLFLNQSNEKWNLKLKAFVTQEEQSGVTIKELLNDLSLVRTVGFSTKSNYAVHGVESPLRMAALIGICSVVFFIFLICLSHIYLPSEKKGVAAAEKLAVHSKEKVPKEKTPSWVADLIILSSFIIAITCTTLVAIILRWRRLKKELPPVSPIQSKGITTMVPSEEHEIHFGGRPNFEGTLIFCISLHPACICIF